MRQIAVAIRAKTADPRRRDRASPSRVSQTLQTSWGIGGPGTLPEHLKALGTGVASSHCEIKVMGGGCELTAVVDAPNFLSGPCT